MYSGNVILPLWPWLLNLLIVFISTGIHSFPLGYKKLSALQASTFSDIFINSVLSLLSLSFFYFVLAYSGSKSLDNSKHEMQTKVYKKSFLLKKKIRNSVKDVCT